LPHMPKSFHKPARVPVDAEARGTIKHSVTISTEKKKTGSCVVHHA